MIQCLLWRQCLSRWMRPPSGPWYRFEPAWYMLLPVCLQLNLILEIYALIMLSKKWTKKLSEWCILGFAWRFIGCFHAFCATFYEKCLLSMDISENIC